MNHSPINRSNRTVTTGSTGPKRPTEVAEQPAAKRAKIDAGPAPRARAAEDHVAKAAYLIHQIMVQRQLPYGAAVEALQVAMQGHAAGPQPVPPTPQSVRLVGAMQPHKITREPSQVHAATLQSHSILVSAQQHAPTQRTARLRVPMPPQAPTSRTVRLCVSTPPPRAVIVKSASLRASPPSPPQAATPEPARLQPAPSPQAAKPAPARHHAPFFEPGAWWDEPDALPLEPASAGASPKRSGKPAADRA